MGRNPVNEGGKTPDRRQGRLPSGTNGYRCWRAAVALFLPGVLPALAGLPSYSCSPAMLRGPHGHLNLNPGETRAPNRYQVCAQKTATPMHEVAAKPIKLWSRGPRPRPARLRTSPQPSPGFSGRYSV